MSCQQALDLERVLPDEPAGTGLDGVESAPFTDARDIDVGVDHHDHAALQKRNLQRHHGGPS